MNYQEQVAALRRQRQQEELRADYNQHLLGREESLRNRQEIERQAAVETDPEEQARLRDEWHMYDQEMLRCQAEVDKYAPPPQPHPKAVEFWHRHRPFRERYGDEVAKAAFDTAHNYLMRPGNAGWKPNTPEYFNAIETLMEMNAKNYGLHFDPNETALSPNEARDISCGGDTELYNRGVAEFQRQKARGER